MSSSKYSVFEFSFDVLPYNIIKIFFCLELNESQMNVVKN